MRPLSLQVARIGVGLTLPTEASLKAARPRYEIFKRRSPPDYLLELEPVSRLSGRGAPSTGGGRRPKPLGWTPSIAEAGEGGSRLVCRGSQFGFDLDLAGGRGRGLIRENAQNIDSVLRALYSALLPRQDGLLLHSAALSFSGRAQLFVGPSGAGKTTLSRHLAGATGVKVLTDELAALQRTSAGFRAFSTPFWGEFRLPQNNGSAPLKTIFFLAPLKKGGPSETRVKPVTAADAQRRLLKCFVSFETSKPILSRAWDLILEAVAFLPTMELSWRKDEPPEKILQILGEFL